jgi:hypothetical protein
MFKEEGGIQNIVIYLEEEQLQWFDHVGRMYRTRILRPAFN